MNVKLRVLTAGVLFFTGQLAFAQDSIGAKKGQEEKIDEVIVLGYSKTTTKPKDITSSVTISSEKLENRPNASFLNSLAGEAPGLTVNSTSGSPGSSKIDMIIRGVGSINASTEPLYVVDGMISNSVQFRNLNPNDIDAVSILKDAAATAIYGSRGSNGVIVIRTKQAKYGSRFDVSYSGTIGFSFLPTTDYNLANSQQILKLQKLTGNGEGATMSDAQINAYAVDTNWRKELFRVGTTQMHDLAMKFGGETVNNYFSVGYMDQTGTVPTTDFKRFTLRNNLNGKSKNNRFNYNANIGLGFSKRHQLDEESNGNISSNVIQNPLLAAIVGMPTLQANQYSTGQQLLDAHNGSYTGGKNIYVLEDVLRGTLPNELTETSIVANFLASYKLTDDLTVSNKSGVDYKNSERIFARAPYSYLALITAKNTGTTVNPTPFGGSEAMVKSREFNFNTITSLNYHKILGDNHTIDAGVYMDWMKTNYNASTMQQNGLYPKTWKFGTGSGYVAPMYFDNPNNGQDPIVYYVPTASASEVEASTLAYFLTLDYDYAGKYGFSGVLRRDGTYRFIGDNKWATFWSVAGRWNIDKEEFLKDSSFFNMLKLRGSYGIQGNQNVVAAAYGTNPLIQSPNLVRSFDTQGLGYNNLQGSYYYSGLYSNNLQWEEVGQLDVGIDFGLWNRRIEGSFDYYDKRTNKLYSSLALSYATGQGSLSTNNGKLQNKGYEALLRYNIIRNADAKLSVYANAAYNQSKILDLIQDDINGDNRNVKGGMLSEWYLIPYLGVNKDNGNPLFMDINGNVTENPNAVTDRRATGKSFYPKWSGGFGLNAEYKNFTLDTHFAFQADVWKWDNQLTWLLDPTTVNGYNASTDLLNAWTPDNPNSNIPRLDASLTAVDNSDRYLKDASFIKLKTVTLGYNIPKSVLGEKSGIKGLKVFVSGENLLTWTKWRGYDPEPTFAYSVSVYPNMRTVSMGVNLDF